MAVNLTEGAIAMLTNTEGAATISPIVQVVEVRLVNTQKKDSERYRVLLSDGVHIQQGMLATQNNDMVRSKSLQKGSIVQLTQCVCNTVQGRKIIIVIDVNVILQECDTIIGEPKLYDSAGNDSRAAPVARPSAQVQSTAAQPSAPSSYQPPHVGNNLGGTVARPNIHVGTIPNQPKIDRSTVSQSHDSFGPGYANSGRFGAPNAQAMYAKPEIGAGNPNATFNSYGRPSPASHQQPPPMYGNRGPVCKNEAPPRIIPITALNPYQGRWTIKARVTSKGELRRYSNAKGEGTVFSFDLLDNGGGEIRATCFKEVADRFHPLIEVGRVYLISKGSLKPAQKKFNHLNNEYEITLDNTSTVELCPEDDISIPRQEYHFRPISDIGRMDPNTIVDVIGVVSSVSPTASIQRKDGTETQRRALQLRDTSGCSVELTMWGNFCNTEGLQIQQMCDSGDFPVLAVKSGRVSEFNGKAIGTISSSQLFIEPDRPEARQLKEWYLNEGRNTQAISISRETASFGKTDVRKTLSQIKDENLGTGEKPDWVTVSAAISFIKTESFCYPACPNKIVEQQQRQCNKKLIDNADGKWKCDRCEITVELDKIDWRYILQIQIQDHTGLMYATVFQECGQEIMGGIPAGDLYNMKFVELDDVKFAEVFKSVLFNKYMLKLKVKEEMYNDEPRLKSTVVKAEKLNYASECRFLLNSMKGEGNVENIGSHTPTLGNTFLNTGVSTGQPTPPVPNYMGVTGNNPVGRMGQLPPSQVSQQYVNQHSNNRFTGGGTTGMSCNSCGGTGHNESNCPSFMNVQGQSYGGGGLSNNRTSSGGGGGGASGECFKCHQTGHWARDCPGGSNASPAAYGSRNVTSGRSGGYSNQRVGSF